MDNSFDHITATPNGDALVLEIHSTTLNDFDLAHATSDEIANAASSWSNPKVIVSLKNVEFVTSVGLILFARLITHAKQAGTRFVLCDAGPSIGKALTASRLVGADVGGNDQRLLLKSDLNSALASFA
jgi:anti-anti-sigma factor